MSIRKRKLKASVKKKLYQAVIIINILWILLLVFYYGFRLIYYYNIEHQTSAKTNLLVDTVTLNKNIVAEGDGLYHENNEYVYKGKVVNNYVFYSGLRWRILGIDQEKNIRLVTDESMTTFNYGTKGYQNSYVKNWLLPTDRVDHTGTFYNNLNDTDKMLTKTSYCVDTISDIKKVTCENKKADLVTLLSLSDYEVAHGKNSYLNNGSTYYTTSTDKENIPWIIGKDGSIISGNITGSSYDVRPVITISNKTILQTGDGTLQNPYQIENKKKTTLKDTNVGEYLTYSGSRYRIIGRDDTKVKVVLDGTLNTLRIFDRDDVLFDQSSYGSVAYYLNQQVLGMYTNPEWIKKSIFYTGTYNEEGDYNYLNTYNNHTEAYIGLSQVGDYFVASYNDVYTLTPSITEANTVVSITGGKLYADVIETKKDIRPVFFLDNTLKLSGKGTQDSPYEVNA